MKTKSRRYAAVRHAKQRRESEIVRDHERAAARLAIVVGMCPGCGAEAVAGEAHSTECPEAR
jgi:hypothetical protein